jgi:serine/threonine-protein kinase HipA
MNSETGANQALVFLDPAGLLPDKTGPVLVGTLAHDRGQIRFTYSQRWLEEPRRFLLDPDLTLDAAPFFPKPELGNFGIFLDSAPDRWGQTLMRRREQLEAKDEGRPPRNLYAWDFLLGVQDETRQGALRLAFEGQSGFVQSHALAAPPVTSLAQLQAVAYEITNKQLSDLDGLRRWLAVLVAPGASLGGARPKANFRQQDGSLWVAKFPARDDDRDVGAWEGVLHELASAAGITVPPARTVKISGDHHTFSVQRFDRNGQQRRFYASSMTMLKAQQSEGHSYIDIASVIQTRVSSSYIETDLKQLFRRVAFNVFMGNRDDHLRNHGFLLEADGWRLAPAFDVNPNPDKEAHVLNIDEIDNRPSIDTVLRTAHWYRLSASSAQMVVDEVAAATKPWQQVARKRGISAGEIDFVAGLIGP